MHDLVFRFGGGASLSSSAFILNKFLMVTKKRLYWRHKKKCFKLKQKDYFQNIWEAKCREKMCILAAYTCKVSAFETTIFLKFQFFFWDCEIKIAQKWWRLRKRNKRKPLKIENNNHNQNIYLIYYGNILSCK